MAERNKHAKVLHIAQDLNPGRRVEKRGHLPLLHGNQLTFDQQKKGVMIVHNGLPM